MLQLSSEEVIQLAPDAASVSAARGLSSPAKWVLLGQDDEAVWGECKGSGAKPYQVQVDVQGPAFKCSCPSRKFPCKHGLALLLMRAQDASRFTDARPAWVDEWLDGRRQRAEKAEAKRQAPSEAVADPQAAAKREAARLERMAAGLQDLEVWMADQVRQGLIQLAQQPEVWDTQARRLVDNQLPGLAEPLRRIGALVGQGEDWPRRVLTEFGRLSLMVAAFARREQLPALVWEDLRTALGWPQEKTAALQGEVLEDEWLVLGESAEENQQIWTRRLWLQGHATGRVALLVDHAHGSRVFAESFVVGQKLALRLGFYPSHHPLRAQLVERGMGGCGRCASRPKSGRQSGGLECPRGRPALAQPASVGAGRSAVGVPRGTLAGGGRRGAMGAGSAPRPGPGPAGPQRWRPPDPDGRMEWPSAVAPERLAG